MKCLLIRSLVLSESSELEDGVSSEKSSNASEGETQGVLNESLAEILAESNADLSIKATEKQWDDYIFETSIMNLSLKGRLYEKSANSLSVSKERMFKEHLDDFKIIVFYCLLKKVPKIDQVEFIDFSVQTERSKGILYLTNLIV